MLDLIQHLISDPEINMSWRRSGFRMTHSQFVPHLCISSVSPLFSTFSANVWSLSSDVYFSLFVKFVSNSCIRGGFFSVLSPPLPFLALCFLLFLSCWALCWTWFSIDSASHTRSWNKFRMTHSQFVFIFLSSLLGWCLMSGVWCLFPIIRVISFQLVKL